ncbi:DNA segregation ATPase%2C FtsK/SpoIIIE family [Mycobacteroides abscessus]|uniref:FtsK/SpoIIIE domain-containing protein n=1 Tax=Mycobacteroides TaxID=670516 RepID=UPI0005DD8A29|nr:MULTISPECIES: FtsK/SpoIIIE domain-containing protein [Mycobacteroides]KRQ24553.1 type VII secretion protein [Mycobacteroides sp. H092]KRQ26058.1 type VII secretion protein [Mycobacteroides sp. H003]KRQ39387.1 type VII secretion protein [Mycobacteroides sp. H101]KRQ48763.1 type VII secretion protein [Mycobacteroides sp. H063]KRQ58500.1 type VII secretion protein [Mycobacteroides sp. H079]
MFTVFRAPPRESVQLSPTGVQIKEPLGLPAPDKRPIWLRAMPLIMVAAMIGMVVMSLVTGQRAIVTMLSSMPLMLMMPLMYAMQMRNQGSSSGGDIDQEIEEYDLELRERRFEIYDQGRAMHDLRTMCFPHPADLLSLVGTHEMWQADRNLDIGRVVAPADESDPDVKNLTSNPYLRARVGIGVAPLYPKLIQADDVVPEMQEPATMVRYDRATKTLSVVANLPIDVRLNEFPAYAMRGDEEGRLGLVRAMLMSLAFNHRPSDLNIGVVTNDPKTWEWVKWLPHTEDVTRVEKGLGARLLTWRSLDEFAAMHAAQIERMRNEDSDERPPHLLLIIDLPDAMVSWPANISGGVNGMTWFVVRYGQDLVTDPVKMKSRILLKDGRVSTVDDYDAAAADSVTIAQAEVFARAMYKWRPRNYGVNGAVVDDRPDHIPDFFEVLEIGDIETHDLIEVWKRNAYTDEIKVPFGYYRKGDELTSELTYLNFYEENRDGNGPHGAVAGRTGSGKSYFLRAIVLALIAMYGPDKVALILADFKGGATFLGMDGLPHVVASISNLENTMELVDRLGAVINGEVNRREEFITTEKGCKDIFDYREQQKKHPNDPSWPPLPDLIVIIDEFGEFLKERPGYLDLLIRVGRVGRSLGMHLVMCSQFINKDVIGDLFEHLSFRYSLSVNSASYSIAMLGTDDAATMVGKKGGLKGKILRKFTTDAAPVEVAAFHHEAPYIRRTVTERARSRADGSGAVAEPVVPFTLFTTRGFTPEVEEDTVEVTEEQFGEKMADVLLEKASRLSDMRTLDLWKPSLREPLSLPTLNLTREVKGLKIRVGDLDAPEKHTRLPWFMDFGGNIPHQVIAGAGKSGRTTLLQTLVVCGCIQHGPERLAFMLADYGTGKLGEVKDSPNVAAYARPEDDETTARILGEASRLIEVRRREMVDRQASSVDAYLASKANAPVADDPYGYVIVAIDGIGGFLGEKDDRAVRAQLLRPILDKGAAVGVHLVYTADSGGSGNAGNVTHYTAEVNGGVQLPSTDYAGAKVSSEVRFTLSERIPVDQPGRSLDPLTLLQCRTAVPIFREIEEDGYVKGMKDFKIHDHGEEIRNLCLHLSAELAEQRVVRVLPADPVIDYEQVWSAFAPLSDKDRHPVNTIIPLGVRMDTLSLAPVPNFSQNLLVYSEKGAGKTNLLRSVMESVMRQFTPKDAIIIVIDPLRQHLGERDRLYERGFVKPAKFREVERDGAMVRERIRPPGYVTSAEDIADTAEMLVKLMGSRRPTDDATAEQLSSRTFFTGPEVYVFVDNFANMSKGHSAKSVFDEVRYGGVSVSELLATGTDLGVHFIVSDSSSGFAGRVKSSEFLVALRENMMAPILQLASPPSSGDPIGQAYHLKPMRWRAGQGRIIVDADDYVMVQTARIDVDAVARRLQQEQQALRQSA